jgi:hypothetical protein
MAHLDLQAGRFAAADTLLGTRDRRRIGHNTIARRVDPDTIAVRYHATDIYRMTRDGWAILSTGGWDTVTTWSRINALLPGPFACYSHRGRRSIYVRGHAVTPYADGLAVHVGSTMAGGTDAIGMQTPDGIGQLLSADDIASIIAADEVDQARRATARDARLSREHPAVDGVRLHSARLWNRRARWCERCTIEERAERDAHRAILTAEHVAMGSTLARNPNAADPWTDAEYTAAGSHIRRETVREYPPLAGAPDWKRDYSAEPVVSERVTVACPWECPQHDRGY